MGPNTNIGGSAYQSERRYRRFPLRYPVSVNLSAGDSAQGIQAFSKNVSIGGMLLEAPAAIPEHSSITFTLTVNADDAVRPIQLAGEGEVVRVELPGEDGHFAIAVECRRPISEIEYLAAS